MFVPFHKCPNSHKYIYIFFVSSCSQEKASSKHNLMQENILTETLWPAAGYIFSLQTKQQLKKRLSNVSQVCQGDLGARVQFAFENKLFELGSQSLTGSSKVSWLNRDRNREYFLRPGNISFYCFPERFYDRALSIFKLVPSQARSQVEEGLKTKIRSFFLCNLWSQTEFSEHLGKFRRWCLDKRENKFT